MNHTSLPGTRPEGSRDEREAAVRVRDMFTRIAPRYDFLNHLLSLSLDRVWRRRTARRFLHILRRPDARVLDLCCGTGDLAFALDRARAGALAAPEGRAPIVGGDFVEAMLVRAAEKSRRARHAAGFAAADALHLPFPDGSFDLVTTAFGFRNLANYEEGLREFARVLKSGGEIGILEFTEPDSGALGGIFRFYFRHILPRIGAAVSGNKDAYEYLPASVRKFPSPPALAALMEKTGFADVRIASWNFGSVILHTARRE
ncbi:MAG TPA: bifunctional demethylmenaquinone methyltransferase/2-methoxy-6-polyprenyl-1,4-benzoquinol methylase UbiE [Candidatus Acidoferrales bacterium]|nr:bifunctional demethylmenaquinone methyltransferase/2-methoxy-6-polyprenyl-1,4-benzoquinol methylase UbiE [Candidatus Acidoferrales bacterium]